MRYSSFALRKRKFDQAVADANAAVAQREAARGRLAYWCKVDPTFLEGAALTGYYRESGYEGWGNRTMRGHIAAISRHHSVPKILLPIPTRVISY
jgi:hypothetical protein